MEESHDDVPSVSAGLSLNIINYGNIVYRKDKAYIRSLLILYFKRTKSDTNEIWDFNGPDTSNCGKNIITINSQHDESDLRVFDIDSNFGRYLLVVAKKKRIPW